MLDLQTRVHFEEVKRLVDIGYQKLDRPRTNVIYGLCDLHGTLAHFGTEFGRVYRRRSLFDHFLMPPLDRTFAFTEMDVVSVRVREYLDLDMPRPDDRFFDVNRIVTKTRACLGLGGLEGGPEPRFVRDEPHPFSAAAGRCFEHYRITHLRCDFFRSSKEPRGSVGARHDGHTGLDRDPSCRHLPAHCFHSLSGRPDEGQTRGGHLPDKFGILRKKSVTRMDGFGPRMSRRFDYLFRLGDNSRTTAAGRFGSLIGHPDVKSVFVGFGINRDRADLSSRDKHG